MKNAYTSNALKERVDLVDTRLRGERRTLWAAKTLHRQLVGDSAWMPCGLVATGDEEDIFACPPELLRGYDATADPMFESSSDKTDAKNSIILQVNTESESTDKDVEQAPGDREDAAQDTEMLDADAAANKEDTARTEQAPTKTATDNGKGREEPPAETMDIDEEPKPSMENNGNEPAEKPVGDSTESADLLKDVSREVTDVKAEPDRAVQDSEANVENEEAMDDASPEPPRRMTTRAQANQATAFHPQQGSTQSSTPSLSGTIPSASDTDSLLFEPHPLFLLPQSIRTDRSCGVPQQEADDTRHLLWAYIQKQEVTVRLLSETLEMLRKAHRMKEEVWEWCKAEGHHGEMSDGEDWYDREQWGLAPGEDLRKGADEDEIEVDEVRERGKRGRRRN